LAFKFITETSSQFRKDLKKAQKQGKDTALLKKVMQKLADGKKLEAKYKDHPLHNNWKGYRDYHLTPDWLLIYKVDPTVIRFERLGSHSELFG